MRTAVALLGLISVCGCEGTSGSANDGAAEPLAGDAQGMVPDVGNGALGGDTGSAPVDARNNPDGVKLRGQLDILFVVGTWFSMGQHQEALALASRVLLADMQSLGLDLRIGITSADVGAQPKISSSDTTCHLLGDSGELLVKSGCGLNGGASFLELPSGGSGNVQGQAADVLACMLKLGDAGCVFGQPLLALMAASQKIPTTFLRKDAPLLVVIVTDADDCSVDYISPFFDDQNSPPQARRLRCALLGHVCNGRSLEAVEQTWPLTECREERLPNYLFVIRDFAPELKAFKENPNRVLLAVLGGWPQDSAQASYNIYLHSGGALQIADVCTSSHGPAQPSLRLKALADAFGPQGLMASLCADDLSPAMRQIGQLVRSAFAN